jgi:hypothetical protein
MALNNAKGLLKDIKAKISKLKENKKNIDADYDRVTKEKEHMHAKFEEVIMQLR